MRISLWKTRAELRQIYNWANLFNVRSPSTEKVVQKGMAENHHRLDEGYQFNAHYQYPSEEQYPRKSYR